MKKLALLAVVGCSALAASAQSVQNGRTPVAEYPHRSPFAVDVPNGAQLGGPEGTTATPFWVETFGSGTNTTLPTNWTASGNAQFAATWKWRKVATTGAYSIGVINSTTGGAATSPTNNGWMVYDSDSIGVLSAATPIEGYLTSPIINCTGHSTVQVSFQQHFRRFSDTCYLDVSNNGGGTWTRYPVLPNNTIGNNSSLPANPHTAQVNVTATAANQANVRLRFYYICTASGGGYNWLVDDIAVSELDPVEVAVDGGTFVMTLRDPAAGYTSFGIYPKQLVDTVYPIGYASNFGSQAQASTNVTARIFRAGAQVYNQSIVYNLPVSAVDSQIDYTALNGYVPTDTGLYLVTFSTSQAGDVNSSNNNDSLNFRISDSTLSVNAGTSVGSYFVQNPQTSTAAVDYSQTGVWFEIPANKSDTLTSITTSFDYRTTVGSTVVAQVYKQVGSGTSATWQLRGESYPRTLNTASISVQNQGFTLVNLPMDPTVGGGVPDLVLDGGYYAAVIRGQGNPATNTILLPAFQSAGFGTVFSFGTTDTSDNLPFSYTYGAPGLPPLFQLGNATPVVRPNFGRFAAAPNSISNVAVATLGAAYPNPANTKVTIPVSLSQASEVSVTLSTATGQIVGRQSLGKQAAGRGFEISFPTGNLSNGVYFYTVEAAGEKQTGRVAVAH